MAARTEIHSFYCINCGEHNMDLPRKTGHKYNKHHRKKLYCWHCKQTVNSIECKNEKEVQEFKDNWTAGIYKEEAAQSIEESATFQYRKWY